MAIAWVLAQGGDIVSVVGTKRRQYLVENLAAANIRFTGEEIEAIEKAVPRGAVAGERYPAPGMASVNR
jgi:aryl-alcohol dehydrogenase-like predicted oxidoreductase